MAAESPTMEQSRSGGAGEGRGGGERYGSSRVRRREELPGGQRVGMPLLLV